MQDSTPSASRVPMMGGLNAGAEGIGRAHVTGDYYGACQQFCICDGVALVSCNGWTWCGGGGHGLGGGGGIKRQ